MWALTYDRRREDWRCSTGMVKEQVPEPVLDGSLATEEEGGEVLIRVDHAGFCGSDRGIWWRRAFEDMVHDSLDHDGADRRTFGHELLGTVIGVGPGVTARYGYRPGDVVTTESHVVCDRCYQCVRGEKHVCANERITALVCTPNLNNPTSSLMSDTRRREIAAIAQRFGVYVIEDDVYGPLLGEGRAPPLSHYLPELSFYCTSFTKSVLTGLRIGYLVVPRRLALRTESILRVNSWMAAPLLAEVATRWIHNGNAQALVERQRRLLAARQALVAERFAEHLLGHAPQALSCWMGIPEHWELDSLVRELRHRHIAVTSPDPFMVRGTPRPRAVRLCMGAECSDERMAQALDDMRELFEQYPKIHDF